MKNFERALALEQKLITQVKAGNDDALTDLCHAYQPLIASIKRKYHVRYYDNQDWEQDALIVCYQSALDYNASRGCFGSYYKTRLANHAKTLVRYDTAYRRKALTEAISLEKAIDSGLNPLRQNFCQTPAVPLSETMAELVDSLSNLEICALLIVLGTIKPEEVCSSKNVDSVMLLRARSRVLQKMRKVLLS